MYELARTGQKLIEITSALVWFSYKYKFKNIHVYININTAQFT